MILAAILFFRLYQAYKQRGAFADVPVFFFSFTELLLNFGVTPERIVEELWFSYFTTRYSLVVRGLREALMLIIKLLISLIIQSREGYLLY